MGGKNIFFLLVHFLFLLPVSLTYIKYMYKYSNGFIIFHSKDYFKTPFMIFVEFKLFV